MRAGRYPGYPFFGPSQPMEGQTNAPVAAFLLSRITLPLQGANED